MNQNYCHLWPNDTNADSKRYLLRSIKETFDFLPSTRRSQWQSLKPISSVKHTTIRIINANSWKIPRHSRYGDTAIAISATSVGSEQKTIKSKFAWQQTTTCELFWRPFVSFVRYLRSRLMTIHVFKQLQYIDKSLCQLASWLQSAVNLFDNRRTNFHFKMKWNLRNVWEHSECRCRGKSRFTRRSNREKSFDKLTRVEKSMFQLKVCSDDSTSSTNCERKPQMN